jgi:hypothetical protein
VFSEGLGGQRLREWQSLRCRLSRRLEGIGGYKSRRLTGACVDLTAVEIITTRVFAGEARLLTRVRLRWSVGIIFGGGFPRGHFFYEHKISLPSATLLPFRP